jgi:hypothetical protein
MFGRSVVATGAEANRPLPGDELIPWPIASLAHGITIRRAPPDVWPWLAQMGAGTRGGWYSYDLFDNGRQPSTTRIVPELQRLTVGMVFPASPGAVDCFSLVAFEPERFLVLGWFSPNHTPLVTWAFVLQEAEGDATRLVVRVRARRDYEFHGLPWWLGRRVIAVIHFIMQRKQLLGIARRAESQPAVQGEAVRDAQGRSRPQ